VAVLRHPNRTATRRSIAALRSGGRLEPVDDGVVGLAVTTADLLDAAIADPDEKAYAVAALGRLHLASLLALSGKVPADADAGLAEVIAALSTPLGYPAQRPA
jgi:hypothetical protein